MEYLPHIATIVVALIGGLVALATQRSAARANQTTSVESNRADMEKEAYERARAFDTATINRQTGMIEELNEDNDELRGTVRERTDENDTLRDTIRELRSRLEAYEDGQP